MPNCFQLFRKNEKDPLILQEIDKEICQHFNAEVHPIWWYGDWYNYIGWLLAAGKTWQDIKDDCSKALDEATQRDDAEGVAYWIKQREIATWMESQYDTTAWYEVKS